jgi:translation elongation factor EF-Tu-like GTPase
MSIESVIDIPTRGAVVVGTIVSGRVSVDDVLEFRGVRARCAAIERFRTLLAEADPGDRVGVLLAGAHFE